MRDTARSKSADAVPICPSVYDGEIDNRHLREDPQKSENIAKLAPPMVHPLRYNPMRYLFA